MLQVKHRPMTVNDYLLLPDAGPRFQLVDGEFHVAPAPHTYHQIISRNLGYMLMRYLEDHPLGEIFIAPFGVYLSDIDVFQPDICFSRRSSTTISTNAARPARPGSLSKFFPPARAGSTWDRNARCMPAAEHASSG